MGRKDRIKVRNEKGRKGGNRIVHRGKTVEGNEEKELS